MNKEPEILELSKESLISRVRFLKISTNIVIFQFIVIILLIITILLLFPLKEKEPYFVHFSNSEQNFAYVKKANQALQSDINLVNNSLTSYVVARESINNIDYKQRNILVKAYSKQKVYENYNYAYKNNRKVYEDLDFYRNIEIITISNFQKNKAVIITIKVKNIMSKQLKDSQLFKVTIKYSFDNLKTNFKEANLNPLGLQIVNYNIEKVN